MTPKDNATQLFEKYYYLYGEGVKLSGESMSLEDARQCALLAVGEIIAIFQSQMPPLTAEYYREVRRHLEDRHLFSTKL
jgi:hypothetical protein